MIGGLPLHTPSELVDLSSRSPDRNTSKSNVTACCDRRGLCHTLNAAARVSLWLNGSGSARKGSVSPFVFPG